MWIIRVKGKGKLARFKPNHGGNGTVASIKDASHYEYPPIREAIALRSDGVYQAIAITKVQEDKYTESWIWERK